MKLDEKVKENAIIGHYFNSGELKKYIGQECYFANGLEDFSNLAYTINGVLKAVEPDYDECYLADTAISGRPAGLFYYSFCLPAEFVKEKIL